MPTNVFFNNFGSSQEQNLIENLIVESIKIYGHDVFYCPRTLVDKDTILGEDASSKYDKAFEIEMYIRNIEGFEGEGDLLSKFNLEIRDRITFTLAVRTYDNEVATVEGAGRPNEGDLIYFPLNKKIYQIKFVEHEAIFYQLGSLQTYDLQCELFEYSNEILNTGIPDIDVIEQNYSIATTNYGILTEEYNNFHLLDESGYTLMLESFDLQTQVPDADNAQLQIDSDSFIDFTEIDPFSEGNV